MEEFKCYSKEFEVQLLGYKELLKILELGNVVLEWVWVGFLKIGGQLGVDLILSLSRKEEFELRWYQEWKGINIRKIDIRKRSLRDVKGYK